MAKHYGRCSCGEVQYHITDEPMFTHACHCKLCQRYTASAFVVHSIIETENFLRDETSAEILLKQGYTLQIVMDTFVEIWTSPLILNQGKLPGILVTKLNKKHLISYKRQVADR